MKKHLHIGIVGDIIPADSPIMSGQGVYSSCDGNFESIFENFQKYSKEFDFFIGNFEAVLVKKIVKVSPGTSAMKAPLSFAHVLKKYGFKYMSIANNHTMEYGPKDFHWMCNELNREGIITFGHKNKPYYIIKNHEIGIKIGLLSFSTIPAMYDFCPEYLYVDLFSHSSVETLLNLINSVKSRCDHLFIFPHWGNEFMPHPSPLQIKVAKQIISYGADAIFGAHPHIIQDAVTIKSKPVFFSLGNLLSDYFQEELKRNLVVKTTVGKDTLKTCGCIFSTDSNFVIFDTEHTQTIKNFLNENIPEEKYYKDANYARGKIRNELILYLFKHPLKWIFNKGLWVWLISRAWFIITNSKRIKKNPNAVYSGPIH